MQLVPLLVLVKIMDLRVEDGEQCETPFIDGLHGANKK